MNWSLSGRSWRPGSAMQTRLHGVLGGGDASVPEATGAQPRSLRRRLGFIALAACLTLGVSTVMVSMGIEGGSRADELRAGSADRLPPGPALAAAGEGKARMQELSYADDLEFHQPYVAPTDLYVFWGKSSFKGHYALGRVSSAQRVRKVLNVGSFTGNKWEDSHHGHGKLLQNWDSAAMQGLGRSCCATIVVPPMEDDLPLYFKSSDAAINIQSFVSNGNRLIMTGGSFTSLVFLNRYFGIDLKKVIYDKGPFDKQPMSADTETNAIIKRMPAVLPQEGMTVTSVDIHSLPPHTTALYATFTSAPIFEMTFCQKSLGYPLHEPQRGLRGYWCGYNKGMMCTEQSSPEECEAISAHNEKTGDDIPCSCGSVIYDGYDFIGNHMTWMGASIWDETLRSLVSLPEMGEEGKATWPAHPPPPPPPAPGPHWNLRVFSSHYPLTHAPDLNRLAYVGDAKWDEHIVIDSRATITDLIDGLDDYFGQGSYPSGSWAGVFYGRLYIEVEGMYTWCTTSIDGSRIFVGGKQVLANDMRHGKPTENCGVYEFDGDTYYDIAVDFYTTSQEFYLKVEYSGPDTNEKKEILNSWESSAYPPVPAPSKWAMRTFSSGHTIYAIERLEGLNLAGTGNLPWPIIYSREYLDGVCGNTPNSNFVYEFWGILEVVKSGDHWMCVQGTDGSRLFLDGELITWNDRQDGGEYCEKVHLELGRYVVKADGWQRGTRARMYVSYKGPNTRYTQQLIYSEGIPRIPAPPQRSRLAMRIFYSNYNLYSIPPYEGYMQYGGSNAGILLPIFASLTDFRIAGLAHNIDSDFYYVLYGRLHIQHGSNYKFCVSSIDGTSFEMDGVLLIENEGVHDYTQVSHKLSLACARVLFLCSCLCPHIQEVD